MAAKRPTRKKNASRTPGEHDAQLHKWAGLMDKWAKDLTSWLNGLIDALKKHQVVQIQPPPTPPDYPPKP